jgi:meiotic recombination protein REC8, fungi type
LLFHTAVGLLLAGEDSDDEYDPKAKRTTKKQRKQPSSLAPTAEAGRADLYTLKENHDHLLADSFSASFNGGSGIGSDLFGFSSSSGLGGGGAVNFDFNDDLFAPGENLDLGLGEAFARELGEDWGGP